MAEKKIPKFVYRGDGRHPDEIFRDGFTSRGSDDDIIAHIKGGTTGLLNSGYISTSQSLRIPAVFMQPVTVKDPKTGKEMFDTYQGKVTKFLYTHRQGWIYHINTTNLEAIYAPDRLEGDHASLKPLYNYQQEWSVKRVIPGKNIQQAQHVDGYIYRNDLYDGRGPFPIAPLESEKPTPFKEMKKNDKYAF